MTIEQLRRLHQAASRKRGQMSQTERDHYSPLPEGGFVGEHTKFVVIEPSTLGALLDIAEAAQDVVPSTEFLDDIPGPYAYVRVDELKAVADSLSRLDDR